jgi:RNA polymerase sigma factor (TIGR02999 family)
MEAVYGDLQKVARRYMAAERADHTLQPTAIVNEVFLRLFKPPADAGEDWRSNAIDWQGRAHFLGVAAKQMRRVLIEHGRAKRTKKRAGLKVTLDDAGPLAAAPDAGAQDIERLDEVLELLATKDPVAAKVVELKFFGGLTDKETAEVLGVSFAKVRRDWEFARGWLRQRLEAARV